MGIIKFTSSKLEYGFLGNMCGQWNNIPLKISFDGIDYTTSENLFQALRFEDNAMRRKIAKENGFRGKLVSKEFASQMTIKPRSLEDVQNMIMTILLKIEQHPFIIDELKKMEFDDNIIEDVSARIGDAKSSSLFWGAAYICDEFWIGRNVLGKIWTLIKKMIHSDAFREDCYANRVMTGVMAKRALELSTPFINNF